jgi:hypothetical protein
MRFELLNVALTLVSHERTDLEFFTLGSENEFTLVDAMTVEGVRAFDWCGRTQRMLCTLKDGTLKVFGRCGAR